MQTPSTEIDGMINALSPKREEPKENPFAKDGYTYEPIEQGHKPFEGPVVLY